MPSSAGAHTWVGEGARGDSKCRAGGPLPGAAQDHGDVTAFRWRPDTERPDAKNASAVALVATETAAGVARILDAGQIPLVIGGDCSITIGVIAGFRHRGLRPALLYCDGGPDLYTQAT